MTSADFEKIILGLPEPMLLVEGEGTVIAANPAAGRLFRRTSEELAGKPLTSFVEKPDRLRQYLRACLRNLEGIPGGFRIQNAEGQVIACKAVGGLVRPDGGRAHLAWIRLLPRETANTRLLAYNERIRAAIKEAKAHRESEERWRSAFENSAIGIAMTDLQGRFTVVNSVYQAMLGYSEEEFRKFSFIDVTYEEDREFNWSAVRELLEGRRRHIQLEKRYRRKDGTLIWGRINASLVPGKGTIPPSLLAVVEDITERKRAEEELHQSERLIQEFWNNSPNLIFLKDLEGRYLFVNKEFERALQVSWKQIQGRKDDEVFPADQAAAFQSNDRKVLEGLVPIQFEEIALQEDGPHISIVQKFPLFDAQGNKYAIGGIATDITERKHAETELLALRDELTAELTAMTRLHQFSTGLLATDELQPLLDEVLKATIALQNADFGNVQLYNRETKALEIVAQSGFHQEFLDYFSTVREVSSACGRALELRERVIIEDVLTDPGFEPHRQIAASAGFRAVQSTPLFGRNGEPLGMLSTHFRRPHRPSERELRFTDLYARQAAELIERKQIETSRRQAEEQYRHVIDTATDAVVSVDESSKILFANPATTKIFGYALSDLVGQPLTLLMPESIRKLHIAGFQRYIQTGHRHINWEGTELVGLRKNGEEFPAEVSFGEVSKNGQRIFTGFIRDITERKQAEELRNAQSQRAALRAEVAAAFTSGDSLGVILHGCAEAIVEHLKAAFARVWLLNKEEGMLELKASAGMYTHLNGPHSRVPIGRLKIGLIAQERKPHLTNDVINDPRISDKAWAQKEGMVAFAGYPLMVEDRIVGVMAMFARTPLTPAALDTLASVADSVAQGIERKQAEQKVRSSERSLRLLTETIPQMLWSATPDGAIDYCNQRVLEYTGVPAEEIKGTGWMKAVHPDDVERMAATWRASVETGSPYQCEFLGFHAPDGTYRWCVSSALPLCDQEGQIVKWYGSVVDLEDWKRAQEALQESEQRFRLLVEKVEDYAIFMLDPEGRVATWNAGAERVKGYDSDEILGRHFSCFYEASDIAERKPQQHLEEAEEKGHFQEEGWRKRKDGSHFWADIVITAIRTEDGKLLGFSKVTRDLTERKRFEQELKYERDRLRLILDINNRIASNLDLQELFAIIAEELRRIMECDMVGVALPEVGSSELRQQFLDFPKSNGRLRNGLLIPVDGSPAGLAFRKAQPIAVPRLQGVFEDPEYFGGSKGQEFSRIVRDEGFKSGCFLPLVRRNRAIGVLQLVRRQEFSFAADDLNFLAQVANQIAIAFDNALSYQQVSESRERLATEKSYLEEEIRKEYNFEEIVGSSPALLELLHKVRLAAPTDSSVLITGETGTGKELIARALHAGSSRKDRPLIKVNCGSIPAGLVESELFGHVKGAFTGASTNRTGRFEVANRGTLFLDEVGELPLDTQVKLLRVLQEHEFEPVGSNRTVRVDVRIIAATNRDLGEEVKTGQFRSDLYYRLNVLPLRVPALRERREDIPQIVLFFLDRFSKRTGKKIGAVSQDTMELLVNYPWPGNVRELQNVIERGVVLSSTAVLTLGPDLLPSEGHEERPQGVLKDLSSSGYSTGKAKAREGVEKAAASLEEMERRHIQSVLNTTGGQISGSRGAAAILKINPNTLRSRMKKLGITTKPHDIS